MGAVQERNWFYGEPGLGFYREPGLGEIGARSGPLRAQHTGNQAARWGAG